MADERDRRLSPLSALEGQKKVAPAEDLIDFREDRVMSSREWMRG
jgi:hypothetical protein